MRLGTRRNVAVATVAFTLGACTLLNPLDAYGPGDPTARDAGRDAAGEAASACESVKWPSRPATDGADIGDVVLAVERVNLGTSPEPKLTGYDLDGVCTCPGPPSPSTKGSAISSRARSIARRRRRRVPARSCSTA